MPQSITLDGLVGKPASALASVRYQLAEFRQQLAESFPARSDAVLAVLDALTGNTQAQSVAELSLQPTFRYTYTSLYEAIAHVFQPTTPQTAEVERRRHDQRVLRQVASLLPAPQQRPFWLFGVDVTPLPRPFAVTLADRTCVYSPTPIRGQLPVTLGHQYSALVAFPEKAPAAPPWVVPLSLRRVGSHETGLAVGGRQVASLLTDATLPFRDALCVLVGDSAYSAVPFMGEVAAYQHMVTIARLRGNRTLYRRPPPEGAGATRRGHPRWYGPAFRLTDPSTWGPPDTVAQTLLITRRGRTYTVHVEAWHDLLLRGTQQVAMHHHPVTLLRCWVVDTEGKHVFLRPMWLVVMGQRRHELPLDTIWRAYGQRYDVEHFFRFGKQRLLLTAYQTPEVDHEENWVNLVQLAYVQLWLARTLAQALPRPWERARRPVEGDVAAPTTVQRDFARILRQIGIPTPLPKPRGKSPGRAPGQRLTPRPRQPVLKKGTVCPKRARQAA